MRWYEVQTFVQRLHRRRRILVAISHACLPRRHALDVEAASAYGEA